MATRGALLERLWASSKSSLCSQGLANPSSSVIDELRRSCSGNERAKGSQACLRRQWFEYVLKAEAASSLDLAQAPEPSQKEPGLPPPCDPQTTEWAAKTPCHLVQVLQAGRGIVDQHQLLKGGTTC